MHTMMVVDLSSALIREFMVEFEELGRRFTLMHDKTGREERKLAEHPKKKNFRGAARRSGTLERPYSLSKCGPRRSRKWRAKVIMVETHGERWNEWSMVRDSERREDNHACEAAQLSSPNSIPR